MLHIISQILERKGRKVWCIAPTATVYDGLKIMADNNIGALVVMDEGKVVGIFSERDYAQKVVLHGLSSRTSTISQIMSTEVCFIAPDAAIEEAMAIATESRCRHLPVMNGEELIGLVSIGDLVKATIDEQEFVITQLKRYIKGEA